MKSLLVRLIGWGALSALPGGGIVAALWKGVRATLKAIATLIGWFWEAVEITFTKPVVLTIVLAGVGLGVFLGIGWDAHLVAAARADRDARVAEKQREVDDLKHQMKVLADRLQETDDADARRAEAADEARAAAESQALAERDRGAGAAGLRDGGRSHTAQATHRRQVRRRCQEPWLSSLLGYCL